MKQYLELLETILTEGLPRSDRTGVGTRSIFGYQFRCDLEKGFPLLTTKRVFFNGIVHELLWFLSGSTNVQELQKHDVHIWDEWADERGELGPVYGYQWTQWPNPNESGAINQIENVIRSIREEPHSRRHIVSAWNVSDIDKMRLPPCHVLFQFYVVNGRLSCQLYQRSADIFLGVPFNIASYALLTHLVARATDLQPGEFVHTFGDAHLYNNHITQAERQLRRQPRALPHLEVNRDVSDIFEFTFDDIQLENYRPHPGIRAPIAV